MKTVTEHRGDAGEGINKHVKHRHCTPADVKRVIREATGRTVEYRTDGIPAAGTLRVSKSALYDAMDHAAEYGDDGPDGPTFTVDVWKYTVYVRPEQRYVPKG